LTEDIELFHQVGVLQNTQLFLDASMFWGVNTVSRWDYSCIIPYKGVPSLNYPCPYTLVGQTLLNFEPAGDTYVLAHTTFATMEGMSLLLTFLHGAQLVVLATNPALSVTTLVTASSAIIGLGNPVTLCINDSTAPVRLRVQTRSQMPHVGANLQLQKLLRIQKRHQRRKLRLNSGTNVISTYLIHILGNFSWVHCCLFLLDPFPCVLFLVRFSESIEHNAHFGIRRKPSYWLHLLAATNPLFMQRTW
jgi:hypothetical protein